MSSFLTQCPHCLTPFRVTETQLEAADGLVRCGACLGIFSAAANRITLKQTPEEAAAAEEAATAVPDPDAAEPGAGEPAEEPAPAVPPRAPGFVANLAYTAAEEDTAGEDLAEAERPAEERLAEYPAAAEDSLAAPAASLAAAAENRADSAMRHAVRSAMETQQPAPYESRDAAAAYAEDNLLDLDPLARNFDIPLGDLELDTDTDLADDEFTTAADFDAADEDEFEDEYEDEDEFDAADEDEAESEEELDEDFAADADETAAFAEDAYDDDPDTAPDADESIEDLDELEAEFLTAPEDADAVSAQANAKTAAAAGTFYARYEEYEDESEPAEPFSRRIAGERISSDKAVLRRYLAEIEDDEGLDPLDESALDAFSDEPVTLLAAPGRGRLYTVALVTLNLLLGVLLAAQYTYANLDTLAGNVRLAPVMPYVCRVMTCPEPVRSQLASLVSEELLVRSHPRYAQALEVSFIFRNDAREAQPFPAIELAFSDTNNRLLANRVFQPGEYLAPELQGRDMPAQSTLQITLELADPGSEAVNYTLAFREP